MSCCLRRAVLIVALLVAGSARAAEPQHPDVKAVAPHAPVVTPGKAKGAWQGEYPIPKPPMPEGPQPADCPARPLGGADGSSPDAADRTNACGAAEAGTPEMPSR